MEVWRCESGGSVKVEGVEGVEEVEVV